MTEIERNRKHLRYLKYLYNASLIITGCVSYLILDNWYNNKPYLWLVIIYILNWLVAIALNNIEFRKRIKIERME